MVGLRTVGAPSPLDSICTSPSPSIRPSSSWPSPISPAAPADHVLVITILAALVAIAAPVSGEVVLPSGFTASVYVTGDGFAQPGGLRSEERRGGEECTLRVRV